MGLEPVSLFTKLTPGLKPLKVICVLFSVANTEINVACIFSSWFTIELVKAPILNRFPREALPFQHD
jgi:hypothetical protein